MTYFRSKPTTRGNLIYLVIGAKNSSGNFEVLERETAFEVNEKLKAIFGNGYAELMESCFEFAGLSEQRIVVALIRIGIAHDPVCDKYLDELDLDDL